MIPANGSRVPVSQVIGGGLEDSTNKPLNFKIEKGASSPSLIARGKDGQLYSVVMDNAIVTINVAPRPNFKQLRKEGRPVPRDKADKIDKQLEKEKKREEKVASGEISAEDAAKEAQEDAKEEAKEAREEAEKEDKESEKEEPAAATLTGRDSGTSRGRSNR